MKEFWRTYWALMFALATMICGAFVVSSMVNAQTAPLGNGGPALNCSDTTLLCTGGFSVGLNLGNANTWTATQTVPNLIDSGLAASSGIVCTDAGKQLTTTGCSAGGGDTITSPVGSLTVGGTSSATTLDLALGHTNAWTAAQTNTAQWQALGAGGANACAGTKYPATVYGLCLGANNGTTNIIAAVVGPVSADFNCSATCTAGDSARIRWFDSLTTGANACDTWYAQSPNAWDVGCRLNVGGEAQVQMLRNSATNAWNGTCASVSATFHCVTGTIATHATSETALTCFQMDVTNHAFAVDTAVTLTDGAAYTFTSTIPNGFVGSTSTAPTTGDTAVWFCIKP